MGKIFLIILVGFSPLATGQNFWNMTRDFPGGEKASMALLNDSIIFAGSARGLWISEHAGAANTWRSTLLHSPVFAILATPDGRVIAGGIGKIYLSRDKGVSWDSVMLQTSYPVHHIRQTSGGEFFAAAGIFDPQAGFLGDGVFFNNGNSGTWEKRTNGLNMAEKYIDAMATDRKGNVYIAVSDANARNTGGIFISSNLGLTWQQISLRMSFGTSVIDNFSVRYSASISVLPSDSICISVDGAAGSAAVAVNAVKHINDVTTLSRWKIRKISNNSSWWQDNLLNDIHVAADGTMYSSVTASSTIGGPVVSYDNGMSWTRERSGISLSGQQNYQRLTFAETSAGRIYMVQFADPKVYFTNRSLKNPVVISGKITDEAGGILYSVQVRAGNDYAFTNDKGEFNLVQPAGWTGTLTPELGHHTFSPQSAHVQAGTTGKTGINFTGTYTGTHFVSGHVTDVFGQPLQGVQIDGFASAVVTNENGFYSVEVPARWSGTIKPQITTLVPSPASREFIKIGRSEGEMNFVLREKDTWIIAGKLNSEDGSRLTETVFQNLSHRWRMYADGQFRIIVPQGWSGTLQPSINGRTFSPAASTFTNVTNDISGVEFLAVGLIPARFIVSGRITNANGAGVAGIELQGAPMATTTDENGNYSFEANQGWTGTLRPVSSLYQFVPESILIDPLTQPAPNRHFTATIITNVDDPILGGVRIGANPATSGRSSLIRPVSNGVLRVSIISTHGQIIESFDWRNDFREVIFPGTGMFIVQVAAGRNNRTFRIISLP